MPMQTALCQPYLRSCPTLLVTSPSLCSLLPLCALLLVQGHRCYQLLLVLVLVCDAGYGIWGLVYARQALATELHPSPVSLGFKGRCVHFYFSFSSLLLDYDIHGMAGSARVYLPPAVGHSVYLLLHDDNNVLVKVLCMFSHMYKKEFLGTNTQRELLNCR
jgi:hypothetical protein